MDFAKKSIALKIFLHLLASATVIGLLDFFGAQYLPEGIAKYHVLAALGLLFIYAGFVIFFSFHKPLLIVFNEMRALLAGKPYKKIFTKRIDEVGVIADFFNNIVKNIEQISVDIAEGKRMSKELSVGSDIQHRILPKSMPALKGLVVFGNTRPASEVGGDTFDIITAVGSPNSYTYVGDVTGHGVPAALIMIMVNTLIRTFSETYTNGYDIIVNTNRTLKQRIEPRRFMTCVLTRWNENEQKLYYTGAGHEHILIFRKKQDVCEVKQTGGIALGMVPDISKIVKEELIPLESGDIVVLYSDGIIEAKNDNGEMYGLNRLKTAVETYAGESNPEMLFTNISRDFAVFVKNQPQEDDITLIAMQKQ